mmetsp:Transcript_13037/g.19184  ORF Transcript_13037/g.19184 Transcript_13037/m.19184 type:complete len:566 (-) Transcript_13037:181-1878(-)|eukprot:CAMPEP_0194224982 /NCGR_PEP_ID=MMETSP0156-20130528/38580_1 /TAXON_ID=33649 /ORGANISM="Thalassionema nitzschioides, Strain L26-B" /LENGTH=565 /DNA_ID=CAMNT_0038956757 /DNA_START=53 /DNA_END=1750 /DNA_ORIENTATION=+
MANEIKINDAPEGEIESCPLLVVPPHCTCDDGDAVAVEGETLQSVRIPIEPTILIGKKLYSDSDFGAEEENMRELEDRTGLKQITHILPASGGDNDGGFDACNEYGYKYVDGDYDGRVSLAYEAKESLSASAVTEEGSNFYESTSSQELGYVVNLLGKQYDPISDYEPRRNDESSLFWFTYRICFPEIVPYKITTDAGWGCMLRSAQMLLGQTLRMHCKSRSWKPPQSLAQRRHDKFTKQIMTWFADFPSKTESIYSLHNMVAIGLAKYETLPGEWYGPSKASYVIRDLCRLEEERQRGGQVERKMFRVHVASQGTVYKDTVCDLMTKSQDLKPNKGPKETKDFFKPPTHPLDPNYLSNSKDKSNRESITWDTSLLLLVPVRLGLQNFNVDYTLQLAHVFSFPQCVGILGGKPRGARWFYGAASDGSKVYGLDPHTIQSCPEQRLVKLPNGSSKKAISITDDYLRSLHTTNPECIKVTGLDPSLALGFYCRDHDDFNDLFKSLQKWKDEHPGKPEIFTVAEKVPDYSSNVSYAMTEMMMSMSVVDVEEGASINQVDDDDDDFVLL